MAGYLRYHVASGHVDSKMTVVSEGGLSIYNKPGYKFVDSDLAMGAHWVAPDKSLQLRVAFNEGGFKKNAVAGESVVIEGLPTDMWVTIGNSDPIKTSYGKVTVSYTPNETLAFVEVVGKYIGKGWMVQWDDVEPMKIRAKAAVDVAAEAARMRVVTPGSGQAMTYLRKADAARMYLAGQEISAAQMLRLEDESTRLGLTLEESATTIVQLADQWEMLDATIDSIRLQAKADIDTCTTGPGMETVIRNIDWPI